MYAYNYIKLGLVGADIQQNTAKQYGGVKTTNTVVSMKGYVMINNNRSTEGPPELQDLALTGTSYIASPGLYSRSFVHVGTDTTDKDYTYAKDISRYQLKYFHIDTNATTFSVTSEVSTPIVASLFGGGAWKVALGVIAGLVAVAAAVEIIRKKKGFEVNDDDDDDEE